MPRSARSSASCGWPPLAASSTAGLRRRLARASQASAVGAPAARQRDAAGSGCGSSAAARRARPSRAGSAHRRRAPRASSATRWPATAFMRSAGWTTTTLPRPRAEVVVREGDRGAHRLDADLLARLALARPRAASSPSPAPPAQPSASRSASGTSTSRSGCERAATSWQLAQRPHGRSTSGSDRLPRTASACASDERELELADAARPVTASAWPCCVASAAPQRRRQPGQRRRVAGAASIRASPSARAHRRRASSAASAARSALHVGLVARAVDADEALAARRASAPGSRRGRARRTRGPRPRTGRRRAPRPGARRPAPGATSNQSVRSGCSPPCTQLSSCAQQRAGPSRGRRPGRRRSRR